MTLSTPKRTHYLSIDILRAFAFLLVFLYHAEHLTRGATVSINQYLESMISLIGSLGWIGVDIFFCISGFLITRVLINNKYTLGTARYFWLSRAVRILPAYYFFLILTLGFNTYISPIIDTEGANIPTFAYFTFTSNIFSYFQETNAPKPYSVIWSLCVEEQFYILWPILFILASRNIKLLCWVVIIVAIIAKYLVFINSTNIIPVYVSMLTRVDGLMYGALACIYINRQVKSKFHVDKLILIPVTFSVVYYLAGMAPIAKLTLTPVISYIFLILAINLNFTQEDLIGLPKTQLTINILLAIGQNSYALYLWHLFVLMLIAPLITTNIYLLKYILLVTIGLSASYVISRVSWHFIESPSLVFKNKLRSRSAF